MVLVGMLGFAACGGNGKSVGFSAEEVKVGDYVTFGSYEQDNDKKNGKEPIEWMVLEVDDDKALLLSRYLLDRVTYNEVGEEVSWEECSLREWLNKDFYKEAFERSERKLILETEIAIDEEEDETVQDNVFLLNVDQAWDYFEDGERVDEKGNPYNYSRAASATEYAASIIKSSLKFEYESWWVLSQKECYGDGVLVCDDGEMRACFTVTNTCYIRPAIWVMLEE